MSLSLHPCKSRIPARRNLFFLPTTALALGIMTGCASGSFSSAGGGTTVPPVTNPNPASLPSLKAATPVNRYVGTQTPGSVAPENVVSLNLNNSNSTYTFSNISIPDASTNPVGNSTGGFAPWAYFDALGDTSNETGAGPGPQYYGLSVEILSRLAFAAPGNASGQIAAMVPAQASSCITPTAAATYQFVVLPTLNMAPATDAAWGTVQLAASGSTFSFRGSEEHTEAGTSASTGLIPFGTGACILSSGHTELGYFIDTPASAANGNVETRSFLGPTGLLISNLQGTDGGGNPMPLPGLLGMVQPASAIDPAKVTGSPTQEVTYRTLVYQPAGSGAQYGLFGHDPLTYLLSNGSDPFLTGTGTVGFFGGFSGITSFTLPFSGSQGIVFGDQDPSHPGLFPHARFLYPGLAAQDHSCPAGSDYFAGTNPAPQVFGFCSTPAVVMVAQHDGKYVLLVTGLYFTANNVPTVMILVQE